MIPLGVLSRGLAQYHMCPSVLHDLRHDCRANPLEIRQTMAGEDTRQTSLPTAFQQWDHVPPPGQGGTPGPHDQWGPGTRVPTLVIAPFLKDDFVVDHTQHDTTSIAATIEHRFGLPPLTTRDGAVKDLFSVFSAKPPRRNAFPRRMHHGPGPQRHGGQRD